MTPSSSRGRAVIAIRARAAVRTASLRTRPITALLVAGCIAIPLVVLGIPASSAAGATSRAPQCPPDCGAVAAGDPLLIPFMTPNPGVRWQAFPAAETQSYVNTLRRNIDRLAGPAVGTNVAAARWEWITHQYGLLITLVSSTSLPRVRLQNPVGDAADLCGSAGGFPTGSPSRIAGIPDSASGRCGFKQDAQLRGALVEAFVRGNVAVLIQVSSPSTTSIDPLLAVAPAQQQYASIPSEGVPVSSGGADVEWIVFWLCVLAVVGWSVVACARRRGSWRGPIAAVTQAFARRKVALGVSVVAVVGAVAFTMLDSTVMRGFGEWWGVASFGDFWQNWADAMYMTFAGGYGHIYVLDRTLETAPALQVIMAPIARLASGLSFPYPSAVLYPTAFLVAGPLYLGGMALPICACDRWLGGMGVTDIRRRLAVLGAMAITLPPIPLSGHPEDLIALGAMLYGIAAAFDGRARATGWWLGVALAFQPFAFLALPIAFVFLTRRQWLTVLGPAVAVPLAFLLVPAIADPSATLPQLLHQKVYDVFGYISPTWNFDPGVAAYVRSAVALLAVPAALVLARALPPSRRQGAAMVIWTVAVLFAFRVFEPELFPYFIAPALALLPIAAARLPWWRLASVCALSFWLTWWLHIAVQAKWSSWLILAAQLCLLAGLAFPGRPSRSRDEPVTEGRPGVRKHPDRVLVRQ